MRIRLFLAAVLVLGLSGTVLTQEESFKDKVRDLLHEGIDLYERGKYQESYSKFEQAFQLKPSSDTLYAFVKRVGMDVVTEMMFNAPDQNMRDVGQRLFALSKGGEAMRDGKDKVLQYVQELDSESHETFMNAAFHIESIGAWTARFMVPLLKDQNKDRLRTRAIMILTKMGTSMTLPLVEALNSPDAFLRAQAAIVLGNIKDDRALPMLKKLHEDSNQPPNVRAMVHEAIQKITREKDASKWKPAVDYYYELACKYYYSHASVIHAWERYFLVWKWDVEADRLTERQVARFAFNEHLAEEALYDLLEMDPDYVHPESGESAWSLLAMVNFQQVLEARTGVESALRSLALEMVTEEQFINMIGNLDGYARGEVEPIGGQIAAAGSIPEKKTILYRYLAKDAKVIRANVLARIPGREYVYEALNRSLKDGNHLVAKACIGAIRILGRPEDLPLPPPPPLTPDQIAAGEPEPPKAVDAPGYPLILALTHEDKRVRYAAAEAMVEINPQERKLGMELVIPNLVDALGEQGVRVALVIYDVQDAEDLNFVNAFKKTLIKLNIFPVVARSGSEGLIKAREFPTEDLIIVQRKVASQVYFREDHVRSPIVETVFNALTNDVRTKHIPRVLLCTDKEDLANARREYDLTAQGYITPEEHELDLNNLLQKIFDLPEAKKDAKDRADEISRDAAEALSSIDITNTLYPFRNAVDPLIRTLSPEVLREDFIRVPCARALGNFGDARALDVLSVVLDDKAQGEEHILQQKALRLQCARSLSSIFRMTGETPTEEVLAILTKYTRDGDYDIELATGEAVGNATLTNAQRRDVATFRRLKRETYTEDDD